MPTLNIKDPEVYRLAAELAARRGTSMTGAVRDALSEAIEIAGPGRRATALEILAAASRVREEGEGSPVLTDDDLYDERGLPH